MRAVTIATCVLLAAGAPGCSLVFGSSRHTAGDVGMGVTDTPSDVTAVDSPDAPCTDGDGDGVCRPADCDDANPDVYPGAPPLCANGIRESRESTSLQPIADYYAAQEVGFTFRRVSIGATSDRLAFTVLPGTYSAITGVAAFHTGTNWTLRIENLARHDIVGEMGLLTREPSVLLGTPAFAAERVAMAPSYDGNGSRVRVGLIGASMMTALREIGPFDSDEHGRRSVLGPPSAEATALVSNALGSSEATLVVYRAGPGQFLTVDATTEVSTGYGITPLAAFDATNVWVRSSVDGAVLVQDVAMPRSAVVLRVPSTVSVIDDARITGRWRRSRLGLRRSIWSVPPMAPRWRRWTARPIHVCSTT